MDEREFCNGLRVVISESECETNSPIAEVMTFAEAGIASDNQGLVVALDDGSEFQLTIVRVR